MFPTNGRPGDVRGFLHKSFIGRAVGKAVTTFVPGARQVVDVVNTGRSFLGGRNRSPAARPTAPRTATARVTPTSQAEKRLGAELKFGGDRSLGFTGGGNGPNIRLPGRGFRPRGFTPPCDFPNVLDEEGRCRKPTSGEFGGEQFGVGEAVMGRYGAALEPGSMIVDRAVCLKGMQLGNDGLCYNKGAITNKQRQWPAGRKPLLTGGDMRAISTAARAGRRLDLASKRLQKMGMMKKATTRRALPAPRAKHVALVPAE